MVAHAYVDASPLLYGEPDLAPRQSCPARQVYPVADVPACPPGRLPIDLIGGAADLLAAILGDPDPRWSEGLISTAGGLASLATCSSVMLAERYGLDVMSAERIAAAFALGRRVIMEPRRDRPQVRSPKDAAALVMSLMEALTQEHLRVLLLDNKNRLLANTLVYQGTVNSCLVREAELLRDAVRYNAPSILLAHNHPSGSHDASPEDLQLTRSAIDAAKLLGIVVLDHLIIGAGSYLSLRSQGLQDGPWS